MRKIVLFSFAVGALGVAMVTMACTAPAPEPEAAAPAAQFRTDATIKDLMLGMVDTNADVVWLSVSFVNNDKGIVETRPQNDEDWETVRRGAVMLMEATNLLKMPGRKVARAHEKSVVPGIELEPEEMQAMIEKDRAAWNKHADDLHAAVAETLTAIEAKDSDKVFELGEKIELACETCHKTYWYPNEVIPEFKLDEPGATTSSTTP
jgi:predicted nuclease with RNAse H fold